MLAIGRDRIFSRSDFDLRYPTGGFTPTGSYSLALRRTEWPYGQRRATDHDEPPEPDASNPGNTPCAAEWDQVGASEPCA